MRVDYNEADIIKKEMVARINNLNDEYETMVERIQKEKHNEMFTNYKELSGGTSSNQEEQE